MAALVFDACALIALAEREEGADLLASFLANDENTCFVHSINLCEVYYRAYRKDSKESFDQRNRLAKRLDAELVTSDHHEFDVLAERGVCKITFFR